MPTGYTYELLKKKQTFPQFAMSCARNFGALSAMRDEPSDANIPESFEPCGYHENKIKQAERELVRLKKMTRSQCRSFGAKFKAKAEKDAVGSLRELQKQNSIFEAMRDEAIAWIPPTEDHNGLHRFMVEQLEMSIEDEKWRRCRIVQAAVKSPMEFYRDQIKELEGKISYHREGHAKEIERTNRNNAWLKALRESLKL